MKRSLQLGVTPARETTPALAPDPLNGELQGKRQLVGGQNLPSTLQLAVEQSGEQSGRVDWGAEWSSRVGVVPDVAGHLAGRTRAN